MSNVEIEGEYHFERRMFGSSPDQLRSLATWLLEREVEEGAILETSVGSAGAILEADPREAGRRAFLALLTTSHIVK